ncbi:MULTISPECIES: response regulator transcription factor [unclassified Sphingomonas]|uniref:response regulator transcription factor n=1 Tax=unclassified Sphingomonas TaxID=196159 RepID=UPI0006F21FE6|nr:MULTISPECIES: response regulator [unclassified Sphingomonas]KQX25494.1 two-component system response regulator [Sphingomonas sp. Root1294]KQY66484.1 two-component system response regulator [Sphingomonas sp. Root50]KRB90196.1 two-component system response regulator [Sphingomonas sp. Root720]
MNPRHIYIVDDDDALRQSVEVLLDVAGGFVTRAFASGESFLDEVPSMEAGCVLLDLNMPGLNGLEVLHRLRKLDNRFETILLTGQGDIGVAVEAMKSGAIDFIEKPYDNRMLLNALDNGFDRIEDREKEASAIQSARDGIDRLTPRERDVLLGLIDGKANKIIAYELDISPRTVEIYRANLMDKLRVRSVAEAVRIAFAAGLVPVFPR